MRTLILLSLLAAGLAGCSKPSVADLKKVRDEACACKDKECGVRMEKKLEDVLGGATIDDVGKEGMSASMDAMMCAKKAQMGMANTASDEQAPPPSDK